jgi:hypothetical protein
MQVLAGSKKPLPRLYWFIPGGTTLDLNQIEVRGREKSFIVPPIDHRRELRLGESIKLLGYDLDATAAHPGGSLYLTLYWQGLGLMDTSYTVFVHLLDEKGHIQGQRDGVPGHGTLPTTSWIEGEVIVDAYEVPVAPDAPPGLYTIAVGMYDPDTGDRLPVFDGEGNLLGDQINLEVISLAVE